MTVNFALSLSSDGIQLLQRADDGWLLVGNTSVDVPDLGAALAKLREDAMRLSPSGVRTKLLIPNEQIKYITLETTLTSLADVQTALKDATPYAVNELVIDFDRSGGRTFIAAVARETLEEAEAFATQYDFAPQSFAAIAERDMFSGEVFFGPAKGASGPVARDSAAVVVVGHAKFPADVVDEVEDEDTGELDIFTPLPRMVDPEKVGPVLAVPTGDVVGPQLANPDTGIPPPPAKPVDAKAPELVVAPAVTGDAKMVLAAPRAEDLAASGGFASRRKSPAIDVDRRDVPAPREHATKEPATKQPKVKRGKPRFLGLILTAILLIVMALVALWASSLTEEDLAGWFGSSTGGIETTETVAPPATPQVAAAAAQVEPTPPAAAADPSPTPDAQPQVTTNEQGHVLSPAEAEQIYAATGVWQRAPRLPLEPRTETLTAPLPQPEPTLAALAMPVMPTISTMSPDPALIAPINPPAPGTDFQRDADGFILATSQGAVTPQGAVVFSGPPSKRPPLRPQAAAAAMSAIVDDALVAPEGVVLIAGRPSKVPPLRPANAALPEVSAEADDAVQEGEQTAFADPTLAGERPRVRPEGLAPATVPEPEAEDAPEPAAPAVPDITDVVAAITAAAPPSPYVNATARAVRASPRPDPRPRNFARVVSRATDLAAQQAARQQPAPQQQVASQQAPAQAPTQAVSNAPAQSSGAVPGGVATAATLQNAIKLRDVNLIGVYGRPSDRRALVRLGNGRYVKVQVGSELDGGQVSAIGDSALNYVKRGRTIAIQLPNS
ncbi:hypothetical protein [Yoonia sp. MH D7]